MYIDPLLTCQAAQVYLIPCRIGMNLDTRCCQLFHSTGSTSTYYFLFRIAAGSIVADHGATAIGEVIANAFDMAARKQRRVHQSQIREALIVYAIQASEIHQCIIGNDAKIASHDSDVLQSIEIEQLRIAINMDIATNRRKALEAIEVGERDIIYDIDAPVGDCIYTAQGRNVR